MDSQLFDSWINLCPPTCSQPLAPQNSRDAITIAGLQIHGQGHRMSQPLRLRSETSRQDFRSRSNSIAGCSTQDDYEESDSDFETDEATSISHEDMSSNSDPGDGGVSRLVPRCPVIGQQHFTPRPNAFTRSPCPTFVPVSDTENPCSYSPSRQDPRANQHQTRPSVLRASHSATLPNASSYVTMSHDAALGASLTTLLSRTNAGGESREPGPVVPRVEQPALPALVFRGRSNAQQSFFQSPTYGPERRPMISSEVLPVTNEWLASPVTMTWFISTGAALVFSALSFGAGYVWGKGVGRTQTPMGIDGGNWVREAVRVSRKGLSELRWSIVGV